MERSRLEILGCALLALALLGGCSADKPGTKEDPSMGADAGDNGGGDDANNGGSKPGDNNGDANNGGANNGSNSPEPDGGTSTGGEPDAGSTTTGADGGECVPKGCDDLGAECGLVDPGCGLPMLDCDPEGDACMFPLYCGGDPAAPNKCGCTAKTCENVVPGGAECGQNIPDGCGGVIASCGDCSDQTGGNWMCGTNSNQCECAASSCGARVCGTIPDGCGGPNLTCGPNAGACDSPAKKCDTAGACICKTDAEYAATACGTKTCGDITVGGCTFKCGAPCTLVCGATEDCTAGNCTCPVGPPAQQCGVTSKVCCVPSTPAALCAGQACGTTVKDPCTGATTICGCAAGQACVDKAYIEGATGNQCLETNLANLLGGYVVRTHAFTSANLGLGITRAESISKVSIRKLANNTLEMSDQGCVATSTNSSGATTTVAPAYFNIPAVRAPVTQTGSVWERPFRAAPVGLGFVPQLPGAPAAYCDGASPTPLATNAGNFDTIPSDFDTTPTLNSGSAKTWLKTGSNTTGPCTCPLTKDVCAASALAVAGNTTCMPKQNLGNDAPQNTTDCRINDIDEDGLPGFTALANNGIVTGAATAANIKWSGALGAQPHHAGTAIDPPSYRSIVYCKGGTCGLLGSITNTSCNTKYNRVQFHKLTPAEFSALTCGTFYNVDITQPNAVTSIANVKTATINQYFGSQYACGAGNTCPEGLLCQAGQCVPMTSPGACANSVSCGTGWSCTGPGTSCWPSTSNCQ